MPHMAPLNGQLVAFDDTVEVHVSVNREGAELWLAKTEFNGPSTSPVFARVRTFPPNFSQYILLDTPGPVGALYTFRLFAAQSGSPSGDGLLIDELNIPRLKKDHGRKNYLTMCGEGVAQLSVMSGGTFIRGVIGSGSVVSRALLFGTETKPVWTDGLFPTADVQGTAKFLLSAASSDVGLIHVVELEDRRTDGWPDSDRMRPGAQLYYIALVWDSAGNFDFTWKTGPGLATTAGPSTNDPEMVTTKQRHCADVFDTERETMQLSILTPVNDVYVAHSSTADIQIRPTDEIGDVELFERVIPFDASASTLPPFKRVPVIYRPPGVGHHRTAVPIGSMYQAVAFPRGIISSTSLPVEADFMSAVGRIELPSILEGPAGPMLTSCAGKPQIAVSQENNALRVALATGAYDSRVLLLVGGDKPELFNDGQGTVPRFGQSARVPLAIGLSKEVGRVHLVDAPADNSFQSVSQLPPGKPYWFIALAWARNGSWGYAWSDGNSNDPLEQTSLRRFIEIAVLKLTCVTDDDFDDDPIFTLSLEGRGGQDIVSDTYTWDDMESGAVVATRGFSVQWSSDQGSEPEAISIRAGDDDAWHGEALLPPFPVGDGAHFNERTTRIKGLMGLGGQPVFFADVKITISYLA